MLTDSVAHTHHPTHLFLSFYPPSTSLSIRTMRYIQKLCCKSRSILKGSVIILFFLLFSTTKYTNTRNHCMRLCVVLKSAFSIPLTSLFLVFICTHFFLDFIAATTSTKSAESRLKQHLHFIHEIKRQRPKCIKTQGLYTPGCMKTSQHTNAKSSPLIISH